MSMVNLMPPRQKQELLYARKNQKLISWVIGVVIGLVAITVLTLGALLYLKQDANHHVSAAEEINAELKEKKQEEIISRANELSGNIKLTVDVLSNEVLFSKLLTQIGQVLPPGTVLSTLTLDSQLTGGLDLEILSVDYESGVKAQVNLTDENTGIFEAADIGIVSCENEPVVYKCTSTIRVLFSTDNSSFLKLYKEDTE